VKANSMRNLHVYILSGVLIVAALTIFAFKVFVTGLPLMAGTLGSAWEIEKRISFQADDGPVKLVVNIPSESQGINIVTESIVAPKYGVSRSTKNDNRQVTLSTRKASGLQTVFIRVIVSLVEKQFGETVGEPPAVSRPQLAEPQSAAARELLEIAETKSSDTATLVPQVLEQLSTEGNVAKITEAGPEVGPLARKADAAVILLALKGIAARRANGIDLKAKRGDISMQYWLEVYEDGKWEAYDVDKNEIGVPSTYLPWSRGKAPLTSLTGGRDLKSTISTIRLEQSELEMVLARGKTKRDELITFSLFSLPLATQDVYRILVVVPFGIFILVVLRNVIGVKSLGTFMPVLIALAFRETQLVWGLILFSVVVATGLLFRFYLEQLKLLLVPRLASVLIFVVLLMAVLSVLTNALGFQRGLSVALFPMVIMAMTIERVSVLWDERGPAEAITQAIGSLAIASLCYLLMTLPFIEHLFFTFPELLLVLLGATVLLGRYTGYRLLELRRFRALAEEAP